MIPAGVLNQAIKLISISVSPTSASIQAGYGRQLTVTAHYSDNSQVNITNLASYVRTNTRISVSSTGYITTTSSQGASGVDISYEGHTTSMSVTVTAPAVTSLSISPTSFSLAQGKTRQLAVTAHMSDGSTQNVTSPASYSSSSTGRATVNSSGLVTASNSGTGAVNITASYQGYSAVSNGTITAATVESITVSPTSVSLPMGRARQLTVTAYLSNGSTQTVTSSASYSSNNTGRATVSSSGLVTAGNTTGAATITITYSGRSTTMTSTTTAAVVEYIYASPTSFSIAQGLTQQLTITAIMSNSTSQNVTSSASYSSNQTGRATVNSTGLITASGSTGTVNITATYGGQSAVIGGIVTAAIVNSISVSPTSFSIPQGSTQQLTVTAHMSNGSTQNVTSSASYSVGNRFTVSSSGLVTASTTIAVGTSTISISYSGKSTTSSATSTTPVPTIVSFSVEPRTFSIPQGSTQQLTVTAAYSDNSTQDVTSLASYSVDSRFSVSSSGLVTANTGASTGTSTITVSYSGHTTTTSATSTTPLPTLSSISVSPSSFSVEVGSTRQLTVTAHYSDSSTVNVTSSASYTRTNSNITVSSGGLVTGSSAGSSGVNISYGGKSTSTSMTVTPAAKTIVELQIIDVLGGYPLLELSLNSNTTEVAFLIRARYNDNSTRDLATWEYQITDPSDYYIKFDSMSPTPRVYYEGWNVPPFGYSITTSINYTGSEPTYVETQPLTVSYGSI